jgi:hypothetical protein
VATTIGTDSFYGCNALETLSLPVATAIGDLAFYGCYSLETRSLPAATTLGNDAFILCYSLETVFLPASLTTIGANPFAGCPRLTGINVDAGNPVYKVENGKLLSIDGATLIGYPSASGTVSLDGVTAIGGDAFRYCAALKTVSLPAATDIGGGAFRECAALETLSLPAATTIGDYAFQNCSSLETLNLPAATTIGGGAFFGCSSLETLSLPAATSIGSSAFIYTTGTADISVTLGSTAPTLGEGMFMESTVKTVTVKVPPGAAGYGELPVTYSGVNTAANWGNGFRGGGWNGSAFQPGGNRYINTSISLTIVEYTP